MPKESLKSLLKRLNNIIETEKQVCLAAGPTDLETVYERVTANAKELMKKIEPEYMRRHIRIVIARSLKHAIRQIFRDRQLGFEFAEVPQLKKAPGMICYQDTPGHVLYLRYALTSISQRRAGRELLRNGMDRDQAKYNEQEACDRFLDDLAARYGDLPAAELVKLWLGDQRAKGATN